MATFSTLDALTTLCSSIPDWSTRLDELNGQIALRQIELARLTESERPPTRSIKNKGSTESLRPKDGNENPFGCHSSENPDDIQLNPFDSPKSGSNGFGSGQRPGSSAAARIAMATPPPKASSNPRPSPGGLARQSSVTTPAPANRPNAVLRKRKTESLASGESAVPKYRTRSMIIVYYDSAVQSAFEDLVKFVSGSRNSMRKGKMAAKMAEMKRAAELEVGTDSEEEEDDDDDEGALGLKRPNLLTAQKSLTVSREGRGLTAGALGLADLDSAIAADPDIPKLKYVSTRQMGPSRDGTPSKMEMSSKLSLSLLRGYRRGGGDQPDIFDQLDKGLEWCQGQCEHAAHQFLRDGECATEIANIKKRLAEVQEAAEKEMERLKKEEATGNKPPPPTEERQMKTPVIRREVGSTTLRDLEVDDMEVDDEGVDDMEPPKLIFKRSRDVGY